ncbi:helix-turn-helix domain-containing protein [Microbacterium sp. Mu-80]|uniref:Helix-turn-helix domain-containing protein n=1 Tax=Microbacterium bandirmense TaxID=3122050 RepID=A0ABU8LEN0_9MICO
MEVRAASDFGALVAERREVLNLSQAELARRAGVTREWVVRLENGSTAVTLFRLMRVLRELNLVVDVSEVDDGE